MSSASIASIVAGSVTTPTCSFMLALVSIPPAVTPKSGRSDTSAVYTRLTTR
jgi:hypothetical protein